MNNISSRLSSHPLEAKVTEILTKSSSNDRLTQIAHEQFVSDLSSNHTFKASTTLPPNFKENTLFEEIILKPKPNLLQDILKKSIEGPASKNRTLASHSATVIHMKESQGAKEIVEGRVYTIGKEQINKKGAFKKIRPAEINVNNTIIKKAYGVINLISTKMNPSVREKLLNEVNFQISLRGRANIVQLEHACVFEGKNKAPKLGLMMEYCDAGDLDDFSLNREINGDTKRELLTSIYSGILNGLVSLEEKGIRHGDIKADNIFLKKNEE